MTTKFLISTLAVLSTCLCQVQPKPVPFACNLKAFTAQQRAEHGKLGDRLMPAVVTARELKDGYSLQVDTTKVSVSEVAQWVDLERKCCPFFDFQLDLHGADGALWLSLKGRDGVKQFIQTEFTRLHDKLSVTNLVP